MRKRNKDIFWAVIVIAIAVGILGIAFGVIESPSIRLGWSLVLGVIALSSLIKLNWFGVFILLAIIAHINAVPLGLTSVWPVYFAAVLLAIGFQTITSRFTKKGPKIHIYNDIEFGKRKNSSSAQTLHGEKIYIENNFSEAAKYVQSTNLESAKIENNFGSLRVYFDQTTFAHNSHVIVDNNFGKTTLYFPRNVNIDNQLNATFGGVDEKGDYIFHENNATVILSGDASFGNVDVIII